jgi:hypothetical protein
VRKKPLCPANHAVVGANAIPQKDMWNGKIYFKCRACILIGREKRKHEKKAKQEKSKAYRDYARALRLKRKLRDAKS